MHFTSTLRSLSQDVIDKANKNFQSIMLELGIRADNYHCGSGLGGNNFQLLVFLGLTHRLIKSATTELRVNDGELEWSDKFICESTRTHIRKTIDQMFPFIMEKNKLLALSMQTHLNKPLDYFDDESEKKRLENAEHLSETFDEQYKDFPNLLNVLRGGEYLHNPSMSLAEQFIAANVMTYNLAIHLDKGDNSLLAPIGKAMSNFDPIIFLVTVRLNLTLSRIITHNMDEHKDWKYMFNQINKILP